MRYYFDYGTPKAKRKGGDPENALVIFPENGWYGERHDTVEGLAAVFHQANSGVTTTGITRGYLRESCKRVSKAEAFRVHPALAERMKD